MYSCVPASTGQILYRRCFLLESCASGCSMLSRAGHATMLYKIVESQHRSKTSCLLQLACSLISQYKCMQQKEPHARAGPFSNPQATCMALFGSPYSYGFKGHTFHGCSWRLSNLVPKESKAKLAPNLHLIGAPILAQSAASAEVGKEDAVKIANYLCPGNYAVSGSKEACDAVERLGKPNFKARQHSVKQPQSSCQAARSCASGCEELIWCAWGWFGVPTCFALFPPHALCQRVLS
eukprot:1157352-Pelagomonas_calceolata.AAC.7